MPTQLGEIRQPDIVSAAVLRGPEDLKLLRGVEGKQGETASIALGLQNATEANWNRAMNEARQRLRKGENRLTTAAISEQIQNIGPDTGTDGMRDEAYKVLTNLKDFTDRGYGAIGNDRKTAIDAKVRRRIDGHPDLPQELKNMTTTNKIDFRESMVRSPRYQELVQERTRALVQEKTFEGPRQRVLKAREGLSQVQNKVDMNEVAIERTTQRKSDLEKRNQEFDPHTGKKTQEINDLKAKMDADPKAVQKQQEFELKSQKLTSDEAALAQLRVDLDKTTNGSSRSTLEGQITRLSANIDTARQGLNSTYPDHMRLQDLTQEQTDIATELSQTTTQLDGFMAQRGNLAKDLENSQLIVDKANESYDKVEEEFLQDVKDVEGWAADQWIDERIDSYMEVYEPERSKYVKDVAANEAKDFYDTYIYQKWFRNKRIGMNERDRKIKTYNAKNVLNDYDFIAQNGVAAFLKDKGYTDDDQIKRLEPYVGSMIGHMRKNVEETYPFVGPPRRELVSMFRMTNKTWIDEAAQKDPKILESLQAFDKGNERSINWMYMLMGAAILAQTITSEAEETQARPAA